MNMYIFKGASFRTLTYLVAREMDDHGHFKCVQPHLNDFMALCTNEN